MNFLNLKPGISVEGDEINAYRSENKSTKYIYLLAGVHGDEVEGVFVLKNLFEWLKEQEDIQYSFIVIPILNVDGYRTSTRVNAHGVDLNRNLPSKNWSDVPREEKYNPGKKPLSEPENKFLDKLLQKFPAKLILTLHSWKPLLNYNGDCEEVANHLNSFNGYEVCDDIDGHPTPGSLGEYGPQKYNTPVLTYEFPLISEGHTLQGIWEENEEGLKSLLKSDLLLN